MAGKLSVVATPIGNMEDITLRALRVLGEVDLVLCEDTRVAKKLLDRHELSVPTMRYDAHSTRGTQEKILALLEEGKHLALISDAGTPSISDPGSHIVALVYERMPEVVVEAIPGASALTAALSISGIPASDFLFLGFLPHKKGRQTLMGEIAESKRPVVFYESAHRITKALASLREVLPPERMVVVARELTKLFEEVVRGSADDVAKYFEEHPDKVRGELVVLVS